MPVRTIAPAIAAAVFAAATLTPAGHAHAELITELAFDSLPSAQGWTLTKSGPHANDSEASMFAVDGTALTQSTVGKGMGFSSPGNATYRYDTPIEFEDAPTVSLFFTTRVTAHEQTRQDFSFGGHRFSIVHDGQTAYVGIKPGELNAMRSYFTPQGFDGTAVNTFQLTLFTDTKSYEFYLNGQLVRQGASEGSGLADGLFILDGTGTANANAEVTQLVAVAGTAIPEPATATLIALGLPLLIKRSR
ncbi:MAG: hypothetical protein AAF823_10375 [Planctomycetota bacterium]